MSVYERGEGNNQRLKDGGTDRRLKSEVLFWQEKKKTRKWVDLSNATNKEQGHHFSEVHPTHLCC